MPPQAPQQNNEMSPEDAKASMGIATALQDQLMPQGQPTDGSMGGETAPEPQGNVEEKQDTTAQIQGLESRVLDEIRTLREEFKQADSKNNSSELSDLKKQIEEVLAQNDQ